MGRADITVVRVGVLEWTHAPEPLRDQFTEAVRDYLRRSGEEIDEQEEWAVLNAAMLGDPTLLLLAAVDGHHRSLLGFALCRLVPGTRVTGPLVQIWQVYAWPGRARLRDLFAAGWGWIEAWGKQAGATRYVVVTRRASRGYGRMLGQLGFHAYAAIYQRNESATPERAGKRRGE